ncbi:MAG: NusG domain II-containing protein [Candidatus Kapabacteria bacterium]|jgi:hypothetical protein|nr:NusG domain II-containing protein [Candidatus Kapabacteria bacterium]
MNRRNFLRLSGFAAVGTAVSVFSSVNLSALGTSYTGSGFSLEILTDNSASAIEYISSFIGQISKSVVEFEEHQMYGNHIGDIVYLNNNQLIDYRQDKGTFSAKLRQLSSVLNLPSSVKDPKLLVFRTKNNTYARYLNIHSDNILINRLDISENHKEIIIPSSKGELFVSVENRQARVVSTSCKHKTCQNSHPISQTGQHIVCIPNQVRLTLEGVNSSGIDGVSY